MLKTMTNKIKGFLSNEWVVIILICMLGVKAYHEYLTNFEPEYINIKSLEEGALESLGSDTLSDQLELVYKEAESNHQTFIYKHTPTGVMYMQIDNGITVMYDNDGSVLTFDKYKSY